MFQRRRFKIRRSGNNAASGSHKGRYYDHADSFNTYGGSGSLANFDACVEACDAFAASSSRVGLQQKQKKQQQQQQQGQGQGNGQGQSHGTTSSSEYTGKSIMISPDGELLSCNSIPSLLDNNRDYKIAVADGSDHNESAISSNDEKSDHSSIASDEDSTDHRFDAAHQQTTTPSSREEEFESSIYIGNDAVPDGEKVLNGFSARGWNPIMTTMAVRRAVDTLQ